MAKLTLCFREEPESHKPTRSEIDSIALAADGASAIVKVMAEYTLHNQQKVIDDFEDGIYISVLNVLEWLIEPVRDYLLNYGGEAPAPEEEEENV